MNTIDILKKARELISDPIHWCRGCFAKTASGERRYFLAQDAHSWCAKGAVFHFALTLDHTEVAEAFLALEQAADTPFGVAMFNDSHEHADVMAMYDRAIASLETKATHTPSSEG